MESVTVGSSLARILDRLIALSYAASRAAAWGGGGLFVAAAFVVSTDVIVRKVFSRSIVGIDEMSGYTLAMGIAWGMSYALLHRMHIRIDTLLIVLPVRARAFLDILATALFTVFFALSAWCAWGVVAQSIESGSTASTVDLPVMAPQLVWFAGLAFFVVVAALLLARSTLALVVGDVTTVERLIGSRSVVGEHEMDTLGAPEREVAAP